MSIRAATYICLLSVSIIIIPEVSRKGKWAKSEQAGPYQESGVLAFEMVVFMWKFLLLPFHGANIAFLE